jgi:hypothetical protein
MAKSGSNILHHADLLVAPLHQNLLKPNLRRMNETNYHKSSHMLQAIPYYSGFELAHDTYNAISAASDGNIYYVLSSQSMDTGGQIYVYNPETDKIQHLGDLTDICGEKETKAIPQGKSHTKFYECDGKLYGSTDVGLYEMVDGMERYPSNPPDGYHAYPGGHIFSFNLSTGEFEDLVLAPDGEGIVTMTMDQKRKQIYGITWPHGYFIHYGVTADELRNLGPVSADGEAGIPGDNYRILCRSMVVDPRDGTVYYSTSEGDIFAYNGASGSIAKLEDVNLRLDYFGSYDPTRPGSMGYNWRQILWDPSGQVAYAVHGNSGYLFQFDPKGPEIEIVERITSAPSKKSGMYDQFSYGYLGFTLSDNILYYLTGGPAYDSKSQRITGKKHIAKGAAKGVENLHLITYDIPKQKYRDHGPVFYSDGSKPTYVNSIAIGLFGNVYTLARFTHNEKVIQDLVKIPNPFSYEFTQKKKNN